MAVVMPRHVIYGIRGIRGDGRGVIPHRHLRPNTVVDGDCAMYVVLSR